MGSLIRTVFHNEDPAPLSDADINDIDMLLGAVPEPL